MLLGVAGDPQPAAAKLDRQTVQLQQRLDDVAELFRRFRRLVKFVRALFLFSILYALPVY